MTRARVVVLLFTRLPPLLELKDDEQIANALEIMRQAGRAVCDGLEIGVDIDQRLERGARFQDKRPMALRMWRTIMDTLETVRAIPKRASA